MKRACHFETCAIWQKILHFLRHVLSCMHCDLYYILLKQEIQKGVPWYYCFVLTWRSKQDLKRDWLEESSPGFTGFIVPPPSARFVPMRLKQQQVEDGQTTYTIRVVIVAKFPKRKIVLQVSKNSLRFVCEKFVKIERGQSARYAVVSQGWCGLCKGNDHFWFTIAIMGKLTTSEDSLKSGWLTKRSQLRSRFSFATNYKDRWFVLTRISLTYFDSAEPSRY